MLSVRLLLSLAAAAATLSAGPAMAQSWPDVGSRLNSDEAQERVERGELKPLREILAMVERSVGPGRMVRAPELTRGSPPLYYITWLKANGVRVTITVDARSGAVLNVSD
jgi:uncharacterized membrane protein YkoI